MPIPKKKQGEKQKDYMIRCVPQLMKYHPEKQAVAICYKSFKGSAGVNWAISKIKQIDK